MIYRLRSKGKNYCFGNYVDKYGNSRLIPKDQITISALKHWKSEESGNSYPVKWEIKLPNQKKRFIINSVLDNQEQSASVPFSFSYWEGQAVVSGSHSGLAYVEVVRNLSSDED